MRLSALLVVATLSACSRKPAEVTARPDPSSNHAVPPAGDAAPAPVAVCAEDQDCHWDDPCVATACLPGPAPSFTGCDESAPPPGVCRCLGGRCATVYAKTTGTCASDHDCDWDDECMPRRCEKRAKRAPGGCDKSHPPPGDCLCVANVCASVAGPGR